MVSSHSSFNVTFLALCRRRRLSKPMPSECEEENRRGEGSKPNYDSPDKRSLFFSVIAMKMPLHLNLCTYPQCRERQGLGIVEVDMKRSTSVFQDKLNNKINHNYAYHQNGE
jgi:hypothetical protein